MTGPVMAVHIFKYMEPEQDIMPQIRLEVKKAHATAAEFQCDYERFDYTYKLRNEVYRIVDFVKGTDFYKMKEIRSDFEVLKKEAERNGYSTDQFLDRICVLIERYAME